MDLCMLMAIFLWHMMIYHTNAECSYISPCCFKDKNVTLVTALYDIHRNEWDKWKRSIAEYQQYFEQVLSLDIPMVIFVEENLVNFVQERRKDKLCYTKVSIMPFEDIEFNKYYNEITGVLESDVFRSNNTMLDHPEGYSPEYIVITNNKVDFVRSVATWNPFNTSHFYWIDAGYGHGNDIFPKQEKWAPCNLLNNPSIITYITFYEASYYKNMNKHKDIHKLQIHPLINGGFFGGDKTVIVEYAILYKTVFARDLEKSIVDDDQGTALQVYIDNPDLFNFVRGDWYDVFELFY